METRFLEHLAGLCLNFFLLHLNATTNRVHAKIWQSKQLNSFKIKAD